MYPFDFRVVNRVEIDPDTEVRLLRANCCRLVTEDDEIRLYYSVENTREYQEIEPQYLEVDADTAPIIETLLNSYPTYLKVNVFHTIKQSYGSSFLCVFFGL